MTRIANEAADRVAVVGLACRYPDADSPADLWDNVVAGRRAFRRLPDERMRLADYWSPDPAAPDRFYAHTAAVIDGYEFDRVSYRVAGSTYRATDLTHWLALDIAAQALSDAGFPDGDELPRERTAVVVGNTLTGEFTRANLMRLRWPYVRRTLAAALQDSGWDDDRIAELLVDVEQRYKQPFPPVDEDTLAGGLANTIAGRICNYFDLKGGGYTVDGACSSSLLSIATACRSLLDHEVDVAVAGGVDLSIDPFEIIGFAKTGALATGEMLVYDRRSSGFWPGEGCGMVVLMRQEDALASGRRIYATIAGAGISSDGKGGITRPELVGYRLALRRAYRQAGFGIDTVGLFEGHGTGTPVGNEVELTALTSARRSADPDAPPAAIGSIKAMIGHTKAAAGVAGFIKAALAVHHEVLPPTVGCLDPHPVLCEEDPALRVLSEAEPWPDDRPVRAGVTAMGFGGINTHLVLENPRPRRRRALAPATVAATRFAAGDGAELLVLDAADRTVLADRAAELADAAGALSYAELGDLATQLQQHAGVGRWRAAVVARSPEQAEQRLRRVAEHLADPTTSARLLAPEEGVFAGEVTGAGRIGFLFPGQGSGTQVSGGVLRHRFPEADQVYTDAALPTGADAVATAVAQPRIAAGSLAGLQVLAALGIEATAAVGHSLGELAALHWAGSFDGPALLRLAHLRGQVMSEHSDPGTMAGISAPPEQVEPLLAGTQVVIAGYNGPGQTVVAGPEPAVAQVCEQAAAAGLGAVPLSVSHAFHSPLVARSADALRAALTGSELASPTRPVASTVTGQWLTSDTDVVDLLTRQITEPVRFAQGVAAAATEVDLFIEVGPGAVLSRLASTVVEVPALSMDTDSRSLEPLWSAVAAAYVVGAPVRFEPLWQGRLTRPVPASGERRFFASPCEAAPELPDSLAAAPAQDPATAGSGPADAVEGDTLELVRTLVAERVELPRETVQPDSRLLDDLHLSSITVGQVFVQAAQKLGLPPGQSPTSFATATLADLATALEELRQTSRSTDQDTSAPVAGVGTWVRAFRIDRVPDTVVPAAAEPDGQWRVYAPDGHPLAEPLRRALATAGVGSGTLVCLPEQTGEPELALALSAAQEAVTQEPGYRLVVVQSGRGAAALAKTARLEAPQLRTTVVHTPLRPELVEQVVAEVAATTGFREVFLDEAGGRSVPVLRPVTPQPGQVPLSAADVLLVTGGGRGITAECAYALASDTGARLAILGRSDPASQPELAANLARMRQAGITLHYVRADVTDPAAVRAAVAEAAATLGPITAVLHGAGDNQPAALTSLDAAAVRRALAPKLDGLSAVLDAVEGDRLRLVVTFGSIIGRAGLRGEAHYATANDWLADATVAIPQRFPHCRAICLEWSVWAGVGMGERLAVVESLTREGITPITVDQGVEVLRQLLADPQLPPVLVVTGRAEGVDTVTYHRPELPLLRFVDQPLVYYPGVELVVQTRLSAGTDPYLTDHQLDGDLLFPAVLGMEAMAQVATAVRGEETGVPSFEQAEFHRPIVVPPDGETEIRIAALVTGADTVEVAIRSGETGFGVDHFRATLRFGTAPLDRPVPAGSDPAAPAPSAVPATAAELPPVPLVPESDLYDGLLFQGQRFQRLRTYQRVAARHAEAEVVTRDESWFAPYLPATRLLGDPGVRDAFMHGLQVCVPHGTLLPAGFDRVIPIGTRLPAGATLTFRAVERSQDGDRYVYDIEVRTADGTLVERWDGLQLQAVRKTDGGRTWPPALLGSYLQRRLADLLGAEVAVAVEPDPERKTGTARALGRLFNQEVEVSYRPDGQPSVAGSGAVSAAHGAGFTLAVAADSPVGCDVETVAARPPEVWRDLLQPHAGLLELAMAADGGDQDLAATRIWCALEAAQKAGEVRNGPVTVQDTPAPGWLVFRAGALRVATVVTRVAAVEAPVVLAVAV
jgi:enediyne polyketide synthase